MSTRELLQIVKDRGLTIVMDDGRPILRRPPGSEPVTDRLLAVLKIHRERIIQELSKGEAHGNQDRT